MKRPSPDVMKALAQLHNQHPVILEWLQEWGGHELTQLPNVAQNTALAQGRCQVLLELIKFIDEAPQIVAKSKT
jgi:hypothetical protein